MCAVPSKPSGGQLSSPTEAMIGSSRPPTPPASHVLRSAVCERICASTSKVVLVHAPAGFGKTTTMFQCCNQLQASGVEAVWLTLDRPDNDLPRFLDRLGQAVAQLGGETERVGTGALELIEVLSSITSPFVIFLDELELVHEAGVLLILKEVIERLPRRGRMILGSRSVPDLGLGRLRVRGELVEIDAANLRFTLDEANEYFRSRNIVGMSLDCIAQLHARTEGWIAALWLASLALERHVDAEAFVRHFSGSNREIADYLAEVALDGLTIEVREFLLRTSILRYVTAPLCQALCPHVDAQRILEHLVNTGVFLIPIFGEEGAYRYHNLFADFLRNQLKREYPESVVRLHLAASAWFQDNNRTVSAIDHALEGGDFPLALSILEPHAEGFLEQGRMRLLARWMGCLPEASLRERPLLEVIGIWACCLTQGPWEAMSKLERSACVNSDDPGVRAHVNALWPMLYSMQDRYPEAINAGRIGLAQLPSSKPFADGVLCNAMAVIVLVAGEPDEARDLLVLAQRVGGGTFNRMYVESMLGLIDLQEGRMRQAAARFRMAVCANPAASHNATSGNAFAGVLYSLAIYESNQLEQAEQLLAVYLPLARDAGLPDHMISSHVMRARIAFHRGDIDSALQVLTELAYIGHSRDLPRVAASAKLELARLLLMQGNGDASKAEMDRAGDPELWARVRGQRLWANDIDDLFTARARWEIRFGDAQSVLTSLSAEIELCERSMRLRRALSLRVLRALALQRCGDKRAAVDSIGDVLQKASREGFVRIILDEGDAIKPLLAAYRGSLEADAVAIADPLLADFLETLVAAAGPIADLPDIEASRTSTMAPLEPLTRKEIRVLQLLAEGYSNNAIAEKLFVSDSTVRTHLRNINMKLDAHNRTQAVAIARKLSIIR